MNLVTGAAGFIGSHLVDQLLARGLRVRALVRPTSRIDRLLKSGVELATGSLEDEASLNQAMQGVERVFHCAARVEDFGSWDRFRAVNIDGTDAMLRAAICAKVNRFIHVSTSDVYGHPGREADEGTPFRFRGWPYGDTKIEAEKVVWRAHRESGLPVTVIRPASVYGPRCMSFVMEVVKLLKRRQMMYVGGGASIAGLAYVTNVVDLTLLAADSPVAVGQAYNASDGSTATWRDYVGRLAETIGVPRPILSLPRPAAYAAGFVMEKTWGVLCPNQRPLLTRMAVEVFGTNQSFSIEKARAHLGYRPAVDFDEGMERVAHWLRQTSVI